MLGDMVNHGLPVTDPGRATTSHVPPKRWCTNHRSVISTDLGKFAEGKKQTNKYFHLYLKKWETEVSGV